MIITRNRVVLKKEGDRGQTSVSFLQNTHFEKETEV